MAILAGAFNIGAAFLFSMGMGMSSRVPIANDPPILGMPGSTAFAVPLFSVPAGLLVGIGFGMAKGWKIGLGAGLAYASLLALFVGKILASTYLR